MEKLFFMYVFFFVVPICSSLFTEQEWLEQMLLQVAVIPAMILFSIEVI